MSYKVVEFANEEVAVVIEAWLSPNRSNAYWPNIPDRLTYIKALKKRQDVNESWTIHPITRILYETDNVEKALQKVKAAEHTSNLDSTDFEESETKRKRKRFKKTVSFFEESDESDNENNNNNNFIKRPPIVKFNSISKSGSNVISPLTIRNSCNDANRSKEVRTRTDKPTTNPNDTFGHSFGDDDLYSDTDVLNPKPSSSSTIHQTPKQIPANSGNKSRSSAVRSTSPRTQLTSSPDSLQNNCNCHLVVNQVLHRLIKIDNQNAQILAILKDQKKVCVGIAPTSLKTRFPVDSYNELVSLDNEVKESTDVENSLVSYLSTLGGEGVASTTNRILKELFTDKLASQLNFCGGHNKRAFRDLKIKSIIVDSVKNTKIEVSTTEIENAIKVWLKHAPQRIKIAAARAEKAIVQNEVV